MSVSLDWRVLLAGDLANIYSSRVKFLHLPSELDLLGFTSWGEVAAVHSTEDLHLGVERVESQSLRYFTGIGWNISYWGVVDIDCPNLRYCGVLRCKAERVHFPELIACETGSFSSTHITEAVLPKIKVLPTAAFRGCSHLTSVELFRAVRICNDCFADSYSLSKVYAPKCKDVGAYAFENCGLTQVTEAEFPVLEVVHESAFQGNDSLRFVNLPRVRDVGVHAFKDCMMLKEYHFPDTAKVHKSAFFKREVL